MSKRNVISEVIVVFFKLGCFAFGGPAAHIAMMEDEVVSKRKWMSKEHFLDLIGATNLIPGPNSTEMTMHCGHERAGKFGLFAAGLAFIFPALLAWVYVSYGHIPEVAPFFFGIKPVVLVIILSAILKLGSKAVKSVELGVLGVLVIIAGLFGISEIIALLGAGVLGVFYFSLKNSIISREKKQLTIPFLLVQTSVAATANTLTAGKIFLVFLKVGSVLYGSGYVLFAYLDAELVTTGWLTRPQLMDAIAIGQFTPGPVLSTATFIGFQLSGFMGALAATAGIFLPSFLFVLILNPLIPKMRKSKVMGYFLDAVNVAAIAIMITVLMEMTNEVGGDWRSIVIVAFGLVMVFGFKKLSTVWSIIGGALLGYALYLI